MKQDTVNVDALRGLLERGEPVTVLDVRHVDEWEEWSVPGSVNFDAYDALKAKDPDALKDLDLPRDKPVVTVCGLGRTSAVAAEQLRKRGYEALTLEGGMKSWSLAWNTAEVEVPGTEAEVIQLRRTGKGCLSYVVGAGDEALVIDAAVDPKVYVRIASEHGWKIIHVLDTHVHADHLSRSRRLAEFAGATLHVPDGAVVSYLHSRISDGEALEVGSARIEALHTPGHTAESSCYLLDGRALFTGDALFLESVGRPDLEASPQKAREKAHSLYGSLRRLIALDPDTLILPGHTSEPVPFDGKPVAATLAEVKENTPLLGEDEESFVEKIAGRATPVPENYERIVKLNRQGGMPEGDPTDLEAGANRCAAG